MQRCAVCGGPRLELRWAVAGHAGPEGLIPTTDRFGTALADIVRCERCGHMQLEVMPSEADLSEAYAEAESSDYAAEEAGQRATARALLDAIERHAPRGQLLDLGCWLGFLLAEASARGWEGLGVEPSEFASRRARDELGLDVRTGDMLDMELPEHEFQAVVLADVIEHLPDPGAALRRVRPALAPDGVLALALPDAGSLVARAMGRRWWSVIPTHVQFFTRRSMRGLLTREGFATLAVTTAPKAFTAGYYADRVSGYSPALGRAMVRVLARARVADRLWAPDFRDRMLVVARPLRPGQPAAPAELERRRR